MRQVKLLVHVKNVFGRAFLHSSDEVAMEVQYELANHLAKVRGAGAIDNVVSDAVVALVANDVKVPPCICAVSGWSASRPPPS